jgi:formylglycine-generating enzyme required for sulfatase activity
MLAELLAMDYSQVLLVATLRSDFLGTFQLHGSDLVRWSIGPADDFTTQLVPLDKGGFRQVIEGPARMAALPLETGFSEQLVHDIPHGDALPLLAFTLQELWELRPPGGPLSLELYQQHGGIDGAVKRAVDRALKGEKDLAVLREAFLGHLLRLSDDGQVAKQTALWDELPPRSRPLLERLVGGRLLVSRLVKSPEPAAPLRTLEIAHEALLRTWPTLVEWIKEGTEELLQRRRVKRLADDLKPAAAAPQRRQALEQLAALAAAGGSEQLAVRKEAADPLAQLLAEAAAPLTDQKDAALVLALIGAEEPLRVCLADTVAPVALRRRAAESLGLLARRCGDGEQRQRIADELRGLLLNSEALAVRIDPVTDPQVIAATTRAAQQKVADQVQQARAAGQLESVSDEQLRPMVRRAEEQALQQELWASGQAPGWKEHDEQLPLLQGLSRGLQLAVAPDLPFLGDGPGLVVPMLTLTALEEGEGLRIRTEVVAVPVWQLPLPGGEQLELVLVRAGTYEIGSPEGEDGRTVYATFRSRCDPSEVDVEAQRRVQLRTFAMVRQPISQGQWRAVVEALPAEARGTLKLGPGTFRGEDQWERFGQPGGLPVDSVNWNAAVEWLQALNGWLAEQWPAWAAQHPGIGATPAQLALPSESQWEAACRGAADPQTPFHFGATLDPRWARYDPSYTYGKGRRGEYLQRPVPIGFFGLVNTHGLAELHGQLLEWCGDQWHRDPVAGAPPEGGSMGGADPGLAGDKEQRYRLLRGGSWFNEPHNCRAANRNSNNPDNDGTNNGLRPCCPLPPGSLLGA